MKKWRINSSKNPKNYGTKTKTHWCGQVGSRTAARASRRYIRRHCTSEQGHKPYPRSSDIIILPGGVGWRFVGDCRWHLGRKSGPELVYVPLPLGAVLPARMLLQGMKETHTRTTSSLLCHMHIQVRNRQQQQQLGSWLWDPMPLGTWVQTSAAAMERGITSTSEALCLCRGAAEAWSSLCGPLDLDPTSPSSTPTTIGTVTNLLLLRTLRNIAMITSVALLRTSTCTIRTTGNSIPTQTLTLTPQLAPHTQPQTQTQTQTQLGTLCTLMHPPRRSTNMAVGLILISGWKLTLLNGGEQRTETETERQNCG
mmetsp:Transcript_1536/g.2616  ORF Transcript_1536/g.2616 Transcript_1536/m.2616 type:complete len:311 (+) Transcript_1536:739-1671(+)